MMAAQQKLWAALHPRTSTLIIEIPLKVKCSCRNGIWYFTKYLVPFPGCSLLARYICSLWPNPPEKRKEGLVFWVTFLVTWSGAYSVENVIIACTACILVLVLDCHVIAYNYVFCNLIWALRSGSCDKKSCSEHQTLFLVHARGSGHETSSFDLPMHGRAWVRGYLFQVWEWDYDNSFPIGRETDHGTPQSL